MQIRMAGGQQGVAVWLSEAVEGDRRRSSVTRSRHLELEGLAGKDW